MYARVRRCIRPYSLVLPGHSAGRECATLYRPVYNVCVPMQLWRTRGKQTGEAALNSQLVEYIVWNVLGLTNEVITGNGRLVGIRVTEEREDGGAIRSVPTGDGNFTNSLDWSADIVVVEISMSSRLICGLRGIL